MLSRISATHTFTVVESRTVTLKYEVECSWPSRASLMRSTTIEALDTLQLLELRPSSLALLEGAGHFVSLADYLHKLGLGDDAVAISICFTNIYQQLMQRNPSTYLPIVVWGLQRLSRFGASEGLNAAKRVVDMCREAAATLRGDYGVGLARSLCLYSDYLAGNGDFDEALTYAVEALGMQRKAPTSQEDSDRPFVSWEASGEEHVALTSARTISRPYETAFDDMINLGNYAFVLKSVGRWSEALIIATEAINCLHALGKCVSCAMDLSSQFKWVQDDHQFIMSRICAPGPPLAASISGVDDLDELNSREDVPGEGNGSGAQSTALVRS